MVMYTGKKRALFKQDILKIFECNRKKIDLWVFLMR